MNRQLAWENFKKAQTSIKNWKPHVKTDFFNRNKHTKDPRKWTYITILDIFDRNPPYQEVILQGVFESVYLPLKQDKPISEESLVRDSLF